MTSRRALAVGLWLAAAACGASAESARLDAFQATCLATRGGTYAAAVGAYQVPADGPDGGPACPPASTLQAIANAADGCDYQQTICQAFWSSRSGDSDLCSAIGCWFGCEVRFPPGAGGSNDASTICVSRFYTGEPCQYGFVGECF